MALRHAVHGWDQVTRYVDMTPEEEAAHLASLAQSTPIPVESTPAPVPPPPAAIEFTPEPLPEPLEAADQPDDDPIPQFLQTPPGPPTTEQMTEEPVDQPEPTPPGPGWSVSDLLAAAGPPPTLPAPTPPEQPVAPEELQPLPEQPTEPEPASEAPEPTAPIPTGSPPPDDPIAEAIATQQKLTAIREVQTSSAPQPGLVTPAASSVTYREEKTIKDETGWRAEIRYQVAVMAKNNSHPARMKLRGPARRRGMTVEALVEQIIQEREALEHKVLEDF